MTDKKKKKPQPATSELTPSILPDGEKFTAIAGQNIEQIQGKVLSAYGSIVYVEGSIVYTKNSIVKDAADLPEDLKTAVLELNTLKHFGTTVVQAIVPNGTTAECKTFAEATAEVLKNMNNGSCLVVESTPVTIFPTQEYLIETAARTAHGVNKVYCELIGDHSQVDWDEASEAIKNSSRAGVKAILDNPAITPAEIHQKWVDHKAAEGWGYGEMKSEELRTHPCMIPYGRLPNVQQVKDHLYGATVRGVLGL